MATAISTPVSAPVESFAASVVERASPFLTPFVEAAKSRMSAELVERVEGAYAQTTQTAHSLLESADGAVNAARKTPDLVKAKAAEGTEFVKDKAAEGQVYVKTKVAGFGLPTSLDELKTASSEQLANLKAALSRLSASLPAVKLDQVVLEEQVEKVRSAVSKVLESLPKLPAFELPKIDLAAYTPQELVKVRQLNFFL